MTRTLPLSFALSFTLCAMPCLAQRCGVERWSVKTGTDAGASAVGLSSPQPARISELIALTPPHPLPADSRFAPTENTVFVVDATLTDFKLETGATGDSDYHLVLQDELGNTMVAEIPSPSCVDTGSPFATQIASARTAFDGKFQVRSSFHTANIPVRVTGVGFFDFFHHQHGAAPNVIELHPVLDISFNPGPADGDFSLAVSSPSMHIHGGGSSSINLSAQPVAGGTLPSVGFDVSGVPSGVTSHVTTNSANQAVLALTAAPGTASGTFPVTITGSANGHKHSQTVTLNVAGAPLEAEEQKWEYKMITSNSEQDIMSKASTLGADGWELVSVVRVTGTPGWRAFFKRPVND
jgi:hypothetical protein